MKKKYDKPMTPAQLRRVKDADIDFSDIPEITDDFWQRAKLVMPDARKQPVSIRIDADLLAYFKSQGSGYQTRINAVLRSYVDSFKTQ